MNAAMLRNLFPEGAPYGSLGWKRHVEDEVAVAESFCERVEGLVRELKIRRGIARDGRNLGTVFGHLRVLITMPRR